MIQIELLPNLVKEARASILAELRQEDRAAAKEAYVTLVRLISSPYVVMQGRSVKGTSTLQYVLNVVLVANRLLLLLLLVLLVLALFSASRYFLFALFAVGGWWLLGQLQFRLNVELASRFKALQAQTIGLSMAIQGLLQATREALQSITNPRFFETERGYQGELLAEIRKRLPSVRGLGEDAIVEQEFQKRLAAHGLKLRPDLIIHVPYDPEQHESRAQGNYVCFELKLNASEAQASDAYSNLAQLMNAMEYPLGVFINISSQDTHIACAPRGGQFYGFGVTLLGGRAIIHEQHT